MLLFLAYVFPPAAVLFAGRPFSAILNVFLTLCGWKPGVRHALEIVNNRYADKRLKKMVHTIDEPKWVNRAFPAQKPQRQLPEEPRPSRGRGRQAKQISEHAGSYTVGRNGTQFRRKAG